MVTCLRHHVPPSVSKTPLTAPVTVAAAAAHDTGEFAEYRKAVAAAKRATEYADAYARLCCC